MTAHHNRARRGTSAFTLIEMFGVISLMIFVMGFLAAAMLQSQKRMRSAVKAAERRIQASRASRKLAEDIRGASSAEAKGEVLTLRKPGGHVVTWTRRQSRLVRSRNGSEVEFPAGLTGLRIRTGNDGGGLVEVVFLRECPGSASAVTYVAACTRISGVQP